MALIQITPGTAAMLLDTYLPRGWFATTAATYNGGRGGLCIFDRKTLYVPMIRDTYTLQVFLHEVYHAKHHQRAARIAPWVAHLREYEAEMWSMAELRHLGFPVCRAHILLRAKDNVWDAIQDDRRQGISIDGAIYRWAHPSTPAARRCAATAKRRA